MTNNGRRQRSALPLLKMIIHLWSVILKTKKLPGYPGRLNQTKKTGNAIQLKFIVGYGLINFKLCISYIPNRREFTNIFVGFMRTSKAEGYN